MQHGGIYNPFTGKDTQLISDETKRKYSRGFLKGRSGREGDYNEGEIPPDYDNQGTIVSKMSFFMKRFLNPGIFTDADVDRLLFRNHMFLKFIDPKYLFTNEFVQSNEQYLSMVAESDEIDGAVCDETRELKIGDPVMVYLSEGEYKEEGKVIQGFVSSISVSDGSYTIFYKSTEKDSTGNSVYKQYTPKQNGTVSVQPYQFLREQLGCIDKTSSNFFRLNDQSDVPFTNLDLFNFLYMYKYNLKKTYSKGRLLLTFHALSVFGSSLTHETVVDTENAKDSNGNGIPLNYNGKPFLECVQNALLKDVKDVLRFEGDKDETGEYRRGEDAKQKVFRMLLDQAKQIGQINEPRIKELEEVFAKRAKEIDVSLEQKETEAEAGAGAGAGVETKLGGGKKKTKYRIKKNCIKTKKVGGWNPFKSISDAWTKRHEAFIYRKLNKYINTENIARFTSGKWYRYFQKDGPELPKHVRDFLEEEQLMFLANAVIYIDHVRNNPNSDISTVQEYIDEQFLYTSKTERLLSLRNGLAGKLKTELNGISDHKEKVTKLIDELVRLGTTKIGEAKVPVDVPETPDRLDTSTAGGQRGGINFYRPYRATKHYTRRAVKATGQGLGYVGKGIAKYVARGSRYSGANYLATKLGQGLTSAGRFAYNNAPTRTLRYLGKKLNQGYQYVKRSILTWYADVDHAFEYSYRMMVWYRTYRLYHPDENSSIQGASLQTSNVNKLSHYTLIEFFKTFVFCNMLMPHFTCSSAGNLALFAGSQGIGVFGAAAGTGSAVYGSAAGITAALPAGAVGTTGIVGSATGAGLATAPVVSLGHMSSNIMSPHCITSMFIALYMMGSLVFLKENTKIRETQKEGLVKGFGPIALK